MTDLIDLRQRALLSMALLVLLMLSLAPLPVDAQCNTVCGPSGGGGVSCTVTLTQSPCAAGGDNLCTAYPPSETMVMTSVFMSSNANCLPGAASDSAAMAAHSPGQGLPAECIFRFRVARCSSGACSAAAANTVLCTVNVADGLPVELMEFSVEEEDEEPPSGAPPE